MDEEKFIQRVEMMLFDTCGCNNDESIIILEKCLERVKKLKEQGYITIKTKTSDADNVKVDLGEMRKFKEQNAKERLAFIDFWANYIRTHPDKEWSEQQNIVIDGQISPLQS